jgi:FtsZ-interacting cell division protein ZipA
MQLNPSDPRLIIAIIVTVVIIAIVVAILVHERRKKTEHLRSRFGTEYDRTVLERGSESNAQAALAAREERVNALHIRDLAPAERERFLTDWQVVQSRFVDHPRGSVTEADELVNSLLVERGYPAGDFSQRAADISVGHSGLVEPYRLANSITARAGRNEATTEELRSAMIQYRTLFDALLETNTAFDHRKLA